MDGTTFIESNAAPLPLSGFSQEVGAFVALELSQSNVAAKGQDFDVLEVYLTSIYSLINPQ